MKLGRALSAAIAGLSCASTVAGASDFIGARRCGTCHEKEYQDWRRSGHALAIARLSEVQRREASCRGCHTMAPADDDAELAGVQCESCHGAGEDYAPAHVMRDPDLALLLGLEPISPSTCESCHAGDGPSVDGFDFEAMRKRVDHRADGEVPSAEREPSGQAGKRSAQRAEGERRPMAGPRGPPS